MLGHPKYVCVVFRKAIVSQANVKKVTLCDSGVSRDRKICQICQIQKKFYTNYHSLSFSGKQPFKATLARIYTSINIS